MSEPFYDRVMGALGFFKGDKPIAEERHAHYFNRVMQISIRPAHAPRAHDLYAPGLHHLCLQVADRASGSACRASSTRTYPFRGGVEGGNAECANSSRMTNTTNPLELGKRIEQLVEEYISATRVAARAAVDRAFATAATPSAKPSRPTTTAPAAAGSRGRRATRGRRDRDAQRATVRVGVPDGGGVSATGGAEDAEAVGGAEATAEAMAVAEAVAAVGGLGAVTECLPHR